MSATQKETFSPQNIGVLIGLLLFALFLGEVVIGPPGKVKAMPEPIDTDADIALRLKPVVTLAEMRKSLVSASSAADMASKPPDQLYQGACFACHGTGAAGAPKLGDSTAWASRIGKGLDALVGSAIKGIGAMPPKGGAPYNDDQMRDVVEYMLSQSK